MVRKTTVWILQATYWCDYTRGDLYKVMMGNLKKEIKSFLKAAQNNAISTK